MYVKVQSGVLTFCEDRVFPMGSVCILWKLVKNKHLTSVVKIMALGISAPCRDGEQIEDKEDEKYIFSDDSSELTIRKVDKNDEAEYVCIAENKAGEQDASIHLKVFGKDGRGQGHCSATVSPSPHTLSSSRTPSSLPWNLFRVQPRLPAPRPKPKSTLSASSPGQGQSLAAGLPPAPHPQWSPSAPPHSS